MRTAASAGLSALRIIEDEAARGRGEKILLRAGREAAVYVLNKKRAGLADIELRYGVSIEILIDESFEGARMTVESSGPRPTAAPRVETPVIDEDDELEIIDEVTEDDEDEDEDVEDETVEISLEGEEAEAEERQEGDRQGRRRRRRRRGGRGRSRREGGEGDEASMLEQPIAVESEGPAPVEAPVDEAAPEGGRRRRRRGGRKPVEAESAEPVIEPDSSPMVERPTDDEPPIAETAPAEDVKPKRRRSKKAEVTASEPAPAETPPVDTAEEAKPARKRRAKAKEPALADAEAAADDAMSMPAANNDTAEDGSGEPRRGWWQRTFG
jgi:ribonuclease E